MLHRSLGISQRVLCCNCRRIDVKAHLSVSASRIEGNTIEDVPIQRSSNEVAAIIGRFLDGTSGKNDWDDFTSIPIHDPDLDAVRRTCRELWLHYPPIQHGHYCSEEGLEILRALVRKLSADDFERILPSDLLASAIRTPAGTELVFPFPQVEKAIQEATAHLIAVLGVEVFRILEAGLGVENYSGYGFDDLQLDWTDYVDRNNQAASQFVAENVHGAGYGYVLTTSSQDEAKAFARLKG